MRLSRLAAGELLGALVDAAARIAVRVLPGMSHEIDLHALHGVELLGVLHALLRTGEARRAEAAAAPDAAVGIATIVQREAFDEQIAELNRLLTAPGEGAKVASAALADYSRLDYYDVWFPNLSPTAELVHEALQADDEKALVAFRRKFRKEMSAPDRSSELDLLAALSHHTNFAVGCYCENESRCHRSVLRELLVERGADVV